MGSGEEDDFLPTEDTGTGKQKPAKKKQIKGKGGGMFASYEEFAHLLDEGLDEATEKKKKQT